MKFRLRAFALHLLGSVCALTLVLGGLYLGWYRWPGWYLTAVPRILIIVGIVDLGLGPTLTFIIANPRKPRRELARDVAIIVSIQLAALLYGTFTLWQGRPLYYTFSVDRLQLVQAADIHAEERARAWQENPMLAPHWYSLPRWVWAPLPQNAEEAAKIINSVVLGNGQDVINMPRYFRPWEEALPAIHERLARVQDSPYLTPTEKRTLRERLQRMRVGSSEPGILILWGGDRRAVAVFDPHNTRLLAILKP